MKIVFPTQWHIGIPWGTLGIPTHKVGKHWSIFVVFFFPFSLGVGEFAHGFYNHCVLQDWHSTLLKIVKSYTWKHAHKSIGINPLKYKRKIKTSFYPQITKHKKPMVCNKYLTHNSIHKTKEVLYPWISLDKPRDALWWGRWKWSMPKTLYEKFCQLEFEMTLGELNIMKKDSPISKKYSH